MQAWQLVSLSTIKGKNHCKELHKKPKEERTIEFDPLGVPTGSNMNVFQAVLSYVAREILGCVVDSW
jgi:hypothetical protein